MHSAKLFALCILSQASNWIAAINLGRTFPQLITETCQHQMRSSGHFCIYCILSLRSNQSSQTPASAYFFPEVKGNIAGHMQVEILFGVFLAFAESFHFNLMINTTN